MSWHGKRRSCRSRRVAHPACMQTIINPENGHRALRRGRVSLPRQVYHVTSATRSRVPLFADHRAAQAACRAFIDPPVLDHSRLLAWVLMPDHAHWLLQLHGGESLAVLVGRLKSASARRANAALGRRSPVWATGYHDRAVRSEQALSDVARYLVANPLRRGLVERIGDYPYWDAVWL